MRVLILGPVLLDAEGGRPVGVDALVDGLWGADPPADAVNALQSLVSRLRKVLGDAGLLTATTGGYAPRSL